LTTHHTPTLHFDESKLLSILRRYYGMTCPPQLNTAHIPQQTYIQVGDETYINLDYSKIEGAGKLCTRVINNVNPLNAEFNPICHFLALLAHHIFHIIRIRIN